MTDFFLNYEQALFGIFPYVAVFIFIIVTIQRYRARSFSYSSLSSQFLENQFHFWGMVPFHYGILIVFAGHLGAFLCPKDLLAWNHVPWRLYLLEVTGLMFAIIAFAGLLSLIIRRVKFSKIFKVTSTADWVLLGLLLAEIIIGIWVAIAYRWGSSWFATSIAPYVWSLIKFSPDIGYISGMPWMVKLHITTAFLIFTFFPFSRLVHILVIPNPYLWRRTQVVRWYQDMKESRKTA